MIRFMQTILLGLALLVTPARAEAESVGIGLARLADWSTEQPFLDIMKLSRPWIGHLTGQWGGVDYEELRAAGVLDEDGWPTYIPPEVDEIGTMVLTALPADAGGLAGRYRLTFEGTGEVDVGGVATNVQYGVNAVEFNYAPSGDRSGVMINIVSTDPQRTGDYVRNITIVRADRQALYDAGQMFNPDWLAVIDGFDVLRFMNWTETNGSTLAHWEDRPEVGDFTYAIQGAPVEVMIQLANETGIDPWFNMPHLADDEFVRQFAETVYDGLAPDLRAYVEYTNEVWNWGFKQARWARDQAQERWGEDANWMQFYGGRAAEVADIWAEVYGDAANDRLVRVVATHTAWLGLEKNILEAPDWVAEDPARTPPVEHFDAYAVAGYFGGHLGDEDWIPRVKKWIADSEVAAGVAADAEGLTGDAKTAYVAAHRFDAAVAQAAEQLSGAEGLSDDSYDLLRLLDDKLAYQAEVARTAGLELVAYEGGTHVVANHAAVNDELLTAFFIQLNYSPEMGALYTQLFDGWKKLGGGVFVAWLDVASPTKWGSWGHKRHLTDTNPRWDALIAARDGGA